MEFRRQGILARTICEIYDVPNIEVFSGPSVCVLKISRYFGFSKVVDLAESFRMH